MQVGNLDSLVVDNEDESLAIISAVNGLIAKGTVLDDKWEDSNRLFISEYGNNIYPRDDKYVDEEGLQVCRA